MHLFILFLLLFTSWLIFSGYFSAFFIIAGLASCAAAVGIYRVIYKDRLDDVFKVSIHMMRYSLWLFKEVAKSSWEISMKMWKLEPEISPQVAWVSTDLRSDTSIAIYGNSITLTPGTVTIGIKEGMMYVHSLTAEAMEDLQNGSMADMIHKMTSTEKK